MAAAKQTAQSLSCGVAAADVTPSAATGATVEPQRALSVFSGPASGVAVTEVTIWLAEGHGAQRRRSGRQVGSFTRSGKEEEPAVVGHGRAAFPITLAQPAWSCRARTRGSSGRDARIEQLHASPTQQGQRVPPF
ncbi:MAG: hypothetical protein ABI661_02325 [Gammaproteobacteria bacterium]